MRNNPTVRSLIYAGDLLAVDLGTFSVKILHVKANVRSATLVGSARREVWKALAEAKSEEEKIEVYAAAVRELVASSGLRTRNASISLAGSGVLIRFLPLEAGFKVDADTGLPVDALALVPFEKKDAVVSSIVQHVGGTEKAPKLELLLAAAERKHVLGAMDIVRRAGLRPAVIMSDPLALAGAHDFFLSKKAEDVVVLVNIGASSTSASVIERGVLRATRVFNIAGNTFTRAVRREFSVEFEEAEGLKIAHGLATPVGKTVAEDAVAERVARALRPAVKDLEGEIQRTIGVYDSRRPADGAPIAKIVLAGGSSQLKGLPELLESGLGHEVEVFRPMVNVAGANGVLGIAPLAGELGVACGLSLSNSLLRRTVRSRLNLVPKRVRRAAIIRDVSPGFWRMIAGPAAVICALASYGVWAVHVAHKETALEQTLAAAAKRDEALRQKMAKKKPAPVKAVHDPHAFLGRLTVSGVFGSGRSALVMLDGGGAAYTARAGRLYDANDAEIPGVSSEIRDNSLLLGAGGKRYTLEIPK